jgi:hypothetical protein
MPTRIETDEQEREIITLYSTTETPVKEIMETYNLTNGRLYSMLHRNGVNPRAYAVREPIRKKRERNRQMLEAQEAARVPEPCTEFIPAVPPPNALAVTTDGQGYVERVERVKPSAKMYTWEVRFESAIRVEATDIEDAIRQVQAMPMCRRVFNVALKGAL